MAPPMGMSPAMQHGIMGMHAVPTRQGMAAAIPNPAHSMGIMKRASGGASSSGSTNAASAGSDGSFIAPNGVTIPLLATGSAAPSGGGSSSPSAQSFMPTSNYTAPPVSSLPHTSYTPPAFSQIGFSPSNPSTLTQDQLVSLGLASPTSGGFHKGGIVHHRDVGGVMPSVQTQNPQAQSMIQRLQQMTPEQLQEYAMRAGSGQQGQLAQQILQQKHMQPQGQAQQAQSGAQAPIQAQGISPAMGPQAGGAPTTSARGGAMEHRAIGGGMSADPWWTKSAAHQEDAAIPSSGYLHSAIPGRTDQIKALPPAGSYVVPADVVSGLGEGNSMAGASVISEALRTGPWGTPLPKGASGRGMGIPRAPQPMQSQAKGGTTKEAPSGDPAGVPALLAGGEFIIHPTDVQLIGRGNLKRGHQILDKWVVQERDRIIKTMKHLKGPVK